MALIRSISGIRGTIGGRPGEGLSPIDIIKYSSAYGHWLLKRNTGKKCRIVLGRDARVSGPMVSDLVSASLVACGIDICDLGMAATPTVEIAVTEENAQGGIILTASHNPAQWNALKLLNERGEFLSATDGDELIKIADDEDFVYAGFDKLGMVNRKSYDKKHIDMILSLDDVDVELIKSKEFTVAIDCVNSVGGIIIPELLRQLGVKKIVELNTRPDGLFPHNPEPLPEHLGDLAGTVVSENADVGFVVDPDVDRLAIVSEDGSFFNEEYTIVAVADHILSQRPGNTVTNMSSSRALRDLTVSYGGTWFPSSVGEVNVVAKMKEISAVIGGEGNGGVILPDLHFGRDALAGIALFLTLLAKKGFKCSELRRSYPEYVISKNRIELTEGQDAVSILNTLATRLAERVSSREDGLLLEDDDGWVHIRKSNTEPILRIYSESHDRLSADKLADDIIKIVKMIR